jgi:hypothetical protein
MVRSRDIEQTPQINDLWKGWASSPSLKGLGSFDAAPNPRPPNEPRARPPRARAY